MDVNNTNMETSVVEEEQKKRKRWPVVVVSLVVVAIGTILISMLIGGFHNIGDLFTYIGKQY